ncbi:hypothetical protein LINPERPRIM_LOCUS37405, partial [Linum perenne]
EGGLGIRSLSIWNISCVIRHIWNILAAAGSIWVAWVNMFRIKDGNNWNCRGRPYHSWLWRKILKTRRFAAAFLSTDSDGDIIWNGKLMLKFSVSKVWDTLRAREDNVNWSDLIWKTPCIPKHCLISWLAVKNRLITKEMMSHWGFTIYINFVIVVWMICSIF